MNLETFFQEHPRVALAFSGGCDSSYLYYAAKQYAQSVKPYFVKTCFQPAFELDDARRLAGDDLVVITVDILDETISRNPADRCYYCKKKLFSALIAKARCDGYEEIIDGTNASDDAGDRPGMKALEEFRVYSPLRMCGITKDEVRRRSQEAGLFTYDKPSYACLATRVPTGEIITPEKLVRAEKTEGILKDMGFSDFRIRANGKIQLRAEQMPLLLEKRTEILEKLKPYYDTIVMDLEARK